LNIQMEHLENHKAQLTVEVEAGRLDTAKKTAARKIAKQVNIPGFRKGKAPYKILANYVGEAAILEEAMDLLGNEVYKEALEETKIEPYGPGELEEFKLEPELTFVFTIPKQPTVDLKDYREVRLDYEEPKVDDEMVDRALQMMQEQQALVEESHQPVAIGDRITVDVHAVLADDEEAEAEADGEAADDDTEEAGEDAEHGQDNNLFMHNHDLAVQLAEDEEPILPGFKEALVGAAVDEAREFELTVPDDEEMYEDDIRGRQVNFAVTVKKIETVTLPALNDEFAAKVSQPQGAEAEAEDDEEPLTLLQLRIRVRENLEQEAERRSHSEYSNLVLDEIVSQSEVAYPEGLVGEQAEGMLQDLDQRLGQEGLNLDTYLKVTGKSREEILADYNEPAMQAVERQLVLMELLQAENITITEENIIARIDEMLSSFGEQAEAMRSVFDNPQMRMNIANDLLQQQIFDRISAIGQGKPLDIEDTAEDTEEADDAEAVVEDAAEDTAEETQSEDETEEAAPEEE
jgi:trigger factor